MKTAILVDIETDGQPAHSGKLLLVGWKLLGEETHVLEWCKPMGSGPTSSTPEEIARYQEAGQLQRYLEDPERPVISMTKYDARYLRLQGWEVSGPFYDIQVMAWLLNENQQLSLDAIVRRYCGYKMDKRLRRSAGTVIFQTAAGVDIPLTEMGPHQDAWSEFVDYCRRDMDAEEEAFQTLWERLEDTTWLQHFLEEEVPFTETLLDMECAGMPVNLEASEHLKDELEVEHMLMQTSLHEDGGLPDQFNLNARKQLSAYLFSKAPELEVSLDVGPDVAACVKSCEDEEHEDCEEFPDGAVLHCVDLLPVGFTLRSVGRTQLHGVFTYRGRALVPTEKTASLDDWSTSSPTLKSHYQAMLDPWVKSLLEYRKVDKMLTTYLRPMPERAVWEGGPGSTPRVFGRFNQTGTKTGRLSSSEPNMQNMPAHGPLGEKMRGLFQGDLVVGDYSQLEPRLMAHFSEDPRLLAVYREGHDVYLDLAHGIFGGHVQKDDPERGIAKVLVLALGYGAGDKKVAQILTINGFPTDVHTAKGYLDELQAYYSRFFAWRQAVISKVKVQGYVKTIGGRHRRLKAAFADRRNWKNVGYGERQAVNAIVQGSAGDIVRRVMVEWDGQVDKCLRGGLTLLAQVHDELVWEATDHWGTDGVLEHRFGTPEWQAEWLPALASVGEHGHGYKLNVPLVFEPHVGDSWFSAKEGSVELPEDMLTEETADYAEEMS